MKCAKCGKAVLGRTWTTPLGEQVCQTCHDRMVGFIVGGAVGGAGGAAAGPTVAKTLRQVLGGFGPR